MSQKKKGKVQNSGHNAPNKTQLFKNYNYPTASQTLREFSPQMKKLKEVCRRKQIRVIPKPIQLRHFVQKVIQINQIRIMFALWWRNKKNITRACWITLFLVSGKQAKNPTSDLRLLLIYTKWAKSLQTQEKQPEHNNFKRSVAAKIPKVEA